MAFYVKAVMFDLDGTLVHTAPEIATAINKMLAVLGGGSVAAATDTKLYR